MRLILVAAGGAAAAAAAAAADTDTADLADMSRLIESMQTIPDYGGCGQSTTERGKGIPGFATR